MMDNHDRALRAYAALVEYANAMSDRLDKHYPPKEAIGDLIGDLCHLAVRHKLDPIAQVRNGLSHFVCEKTDPPAGMKYEAQVDIGLAIHEHASMPVIYVPWQPKAPKGGWK